MRQSLVFGLLFGIALVIANLFGSSRAAEANHLVFLPYAPNTPLMQQVIKAREYTYCFDSRSLNYPSFVTQLQDVNAQYDARVGIKGRMVAGSFATIEAAKAAGCQVWHVMPDGLECSGWAAQIFYANWPVTVQYCYKLGYTDWRSAQGHELGHGLLGLHEQYADSGGSIGCTRRQDTVMDCGGNPPVRYPQPLDVSRGCSLIQTSWCGNVPPPMTCLTLGFDPCTGRHFMPDGWSWSPANGYWYGPTGLAEFSPCNQDAIRWNELGAWFTPGSSFFVPSRGYWARSPEC